MAITPAVFQPGIQLTASPVAIYTVPSVGQSVIRRAVFTNTDTSPRTITVHRVPNAGSASTSNRVISAFRLSPGQAYIATELSNMVLNAGDSIQALADTTSVVNAFISGFTT